MVTERIDIVVTDRGTRATRRNIEGIGTSAGLAQRGVAGLLTSLGALAAFGGLTQAINTIASFGQEMATVRAITGATGDQFAALQAEAQRLGSTTRFSATQAAEGMTFLARAGFETDEVLASIGDTLVLAQAGALDLGAAADIASNVLQGFRLEASEASRVVDVLAFAANNSNTNVTQLGDALKFVAPVAAGLGVSLEETTAAVGALSDAGLQATIAGTGLRSILATIVAPSNKVQGIFQELGLSTADLDLKTQGLAQVIRNLRDAGVDATLAFEIFQQRGGPAFEVLAQAADDIDETNAAMRQLDEFARGIAETMDDTLQGAIFSVISALEGFIIAIGTAGAEGALKNFFNTLADGIRTATANIDIFISAAETLAIIIGVRLAAQAVPALTRAILALNVAILRNPFGFLLTALTTTVAALIGFSDQLRQTTGPMAELGDMARALGQIFVEIGIEIFDAIVSVFPALGDLEQVFTDTSSVLQNVIRLIVISVDGLRASVIAAVAGIVAGLKNFPAAIKEIFAAAFNSAVEIAEQGVNQVIGFLNRFPGVNLGGANFDGIKVELDETPIADAFGSTFDQEIGTVTKRFIELTQIADDQRAAFDELSRAANTHNQNLKIAATANEEIASAATTATEEIASTAGALDSVGSAATGATPKVEELKEELSDTAEFAQDAFESVFGNLERAITNFVETGKLDFRELISSILSDLSRLAVNSIFQQLTGSLVGGLFGGGGGGQLAGVLSGGFAGLFQDGGSIPRGQFGIVGEGGVPEIVSGPATVTPVTGAGAAGSFGQEIARQIAAALATSQSQGTGVTVVNNVDPQQTITAMGTRPGTRVIMNTIEQNASTIRKLLG